MVLLITGEWIELVVETLNDGGIFAPKPEIKWIHLVVFKILQCFQLTERREQLWTVVVLNDFANTSQCDLVIIWTLRIEVVV